MVASRKGKTVMEKVVTHNIPSKKEPVTSIFLVYFMNLRDPTKPIPQVWYSDFDADLNEHGGYLEKTKNMRMPNGKYKIAWEHRFLGIENLTQLYPYKDGKDA